jgi:hypothetical protein
MAKKMEQIGSGYFARGEESPRQAPKSRGRIDVVEVIAVGLILLLGFLSGVVFILRLTSEGLY